MYQRIVGRYLSDEGLHHLDTYHFTGVDHSWLAAHGLNAYWNWLVEWVPLWVAPNVLTLAGFLFQVLGFLSMSYYNPDFLTTAPTWVYFFIAFSLFAYQSLDNIDGKQARRTRSSSPLGELFDHSSDAIGVGMIVTTVGASCLAGAQNTLYVLFFTMTTFYLYHLEEYFTGELILGAYDGPTESQAFTMAMHINAGIMVWLGIDFWQGAIFGGMRRTDVFVAFYCLLCVVSSARLQWRTWRYASENNIAPAQIFRVALPFLSFLALATVYCAYNPTLLTRHNWDESRLVFFLLTILFGYITSRLIVHRVLREPAKHFYPIVVPLALAAAHSVIVTHFPGTLPVVDPHEILKLLSVLALVQTAMFFYGINDELTSYLGIRTFWIPYPPPPAKAPTPAKPSTRAAASPARRGRSPRKAASPVKAPAAETRSTRSARASRSRSRSARKRKAE